MKKFYLIICLITTSFMCFAQGEASDFTGKASDRPRDPGTDQMNFVPNEVLVKFKDDVIVSSGTTLKSAGISSVDQLLRANGVVSLEKLFPTETKLKSARVVKDPTGRDMKIPSLHNIYRITIPQLKSTGSGPADIFKFMEEMKALPEVEYAEPNYIFTIGDFTPAGREMTMLEAMEQTANSELSTTASGIIPNDPLYNSQWGIPATNIDDVWNTTTGDSTAIIAILDTGVDWKHPDLAANIWKNKQEIPDNGRDDDGNGLIDDIRGWDYINNDNNPMDDNSHGTHVAGIAAAVGNNGIGIAGVNWNAKIMPIKVFQSSGKGDAATIAKGITYAASKGATVINMSFGSYTESLTMKDALASAYATAVLVAAAGNDAVPIGPCMGCAPMYPGAFSFVLGVEANTSEGRAGFSNSDQDGPVFSQYTDLLNYELKAPGAGILSCVPGGNYREYNGTSMAAPLVAGAISLYLKSKPLDDQEIMWGNFINTLGLNVNLEAAININPKPVLSIVKYQLADTLTADDWDWKADAGETILLDVTIRNSWGLADSVFVGVKFQEFEDLTTATIENGTALIGAIGPYASLSNSKNQLKIKIQSNVAHGSDIQFILQTWKGSKKEYLVEQKITIQVEHGTELKGVLEGTLRLTPDKFWLVNNSFKIGPTGTLIIKPGTHLKIEKNVSNYGNIISIGKKDSIITIEGPYTITGSSGNGTFKYVNFINLNIPYSHYNDCFLNGIFNFENCKFSDFHYHQTAIFVTGGFKNCEFSNFVGFNDYGISCGEISNCNFINMNPGFNGYVYNFLWTSQNILYNNFASCKKVMSFIYGKSDNSVRYNNVLGNFNFYSSSNGISSMLPDNYWGTNDSLKIQEKIHDFWDDAALSLIKYQPKLTKPESKAHACVWKVVVNGKDAQDEFNILDPLGVASHKFEVYFNRPMDIKYAPSISMGVRYPYNQVNINENGIWSNDSLIYTVYKSVGLTANNGLNRIKVINGKDTEDFDLVPEEERFNVNIQTTASASLDFMATPSLGKVKLEWNNNDLTDGLGFNMYRMEHINDSVLTKPVLINQSLITDTLYSDFAVIPNKKYYYYYKILRTNLSETDSSKVVSAIPFTASKGDANGDLAVNVLDITTIVAYLLNNNPQPFITEAADLNSDGNINVLDIVGVVNLVLGNKSAVIATSEQVKLYMQNDTLFADAPVAVGGIQFDIIGVTSVDEIQKLKALEGFESGYSASEKGVRLLYYSLSGKNIPAGTRIPLLRLKKGSGVSDAIFADKIGTAIPVNYDVTGVWNFSDKLNGTVAELGQNFPNPLNLQTTIPIRIYEPVDEAVIRIVNMYGQTVDAIHVNHPIVGEHLVQWNSGANKGFFAYLLEIRRGTQQFICPVRKMIVQ